MSSSNTFLSKKKLNNFSHATGEFTSSSSSFFWLKVKEDFRKTLKRITRVPHRCCLGHIHSSCQRHKYIALSSFEYPTPPPNPCHLGLLFSFNRKKILIVMWEREREREREREKPTGTFFFKSSNSRVLSSKSPLRSSLIFFNLSIFLFFFFSFSLAAPPPPVWAFLSLRSFSSTSALKSCLVFFSFLILSRSAPDVLPCLFALLSAADNSFFLSLLWKKSLVI